jgi:alpha(1,3/1,4) fucosyltransferase
MKVGVTVRFLNSYFSGGSPQVACALAKALQEAKHDVTLLYPKGEQDWFMDVKGLKDSLPRRAPWDPSFTEHFDAVIEVVWFFPETARLKVADHRILWVHQSPIFHDIESSVYPWNPTQRSFKNITAIMTYDLYSVQDVNYLEFLSGVQVIQVPFVWNPQALDIFCKENNVPEWRQSARQVDAMVAKDGTTHPSVSWCARIVENNFSNTSHCNIPLNILTQIRVRGDPVRFNVHNGEQLQSSEFFKTNIIKNLLVPDISGSILPRIRLPDLRMEKAFIIAHQRFRPLKLFLLDALYLGIPLIHNCELLTELGAPYGYKLNQILDATAMWGQLKDDYKKGALLFDPAAHSAFNVKLVKRFSPLALSSDYNDCLKRATAPVKIPLQPSSLSVSKKELRVHFCELWSEFVPKYNFFMYLLSWIGFTNNISVVLDSKHPNLVIYGPLSKGQEKAYPGISKVWFTGENTPPPKDSDIVLSLGFQYSTSSNYIRLPLWMIEINWFGGDPAKIVNPRPVSLQAATTVDPDVINNKSKFCAFVATNPNNNNRNASFQVLNGWRKVDSAGRLFCNRPEGPIPAGLGGGGGELAKVEFYKDYKFAITYENSAGPGYTTEKLFHAKVAGAVPIYWGDSFVDRDFDSTGFINANQISKPEDLIQAVKKVDDDADLWRKMALVPALSPISKLRCEDTMEQVGKRIFKLILDKNVSVDSWAKAETFGKLYETMNYSELYASYPTIPPPQPLQSPLYQPPTQQQPQQQALAQSSSRLFITAASARYIEAALNLVSYMKLYEPDVPRVVYVWRDITEMHCKLLTDNGATEIRRFPEEHGPWKDFWNPQHFAWKLWTHVDASLKVAAGTLILYLDAGIALACPITSVWSTIQEKDIFILEDDEQTNERWCHPTFCKELQVTPAELKANQILAGCIGYKAGGKYINSVHRQALGLAEDKPEIIVGEKWSPYSQVCLGHRHDQSILSILTQRAGALRIPHKDFYCDRAMRTAQQWGTPFYVHRGNFKEIAPFTDGIDEAYVINLERRKDRLEKFKETHKNIKDRVYLFKATDGRTLTLTPELAHCFRNNDFNWKKSVMGCALSHLTLWEKLANDKLAKSYLIMEDDVVLFDRWILRWMTAAKHIPADADVIYLGGILPPNKAGFPQVAEKVNEYFGRIAPNTLYSSTPRRYFHFCNYAYVLTQSGARKLITLVKERGIFTSGDHMIVNHGDNLLNIYFTTPLLATCFQENDPVYQKSDFNNFNRVDNFDSDLWNNTECFSKEEVFSVITNNLQSQTYSVVDNASSPAPAPTPAPAASHAPADFSLVWNRLLQATVLKNEIEFKPALDAMLSMWSSANFDATKSYYGMFEQLILSENEMFMKYKADIYANLQRNFDLSNTAVWGKIVGKLGLSQSLTQRATDTIPVFYLKTIKVDTLEENDWLNTIFPKPIRWVPLESFDELVNTPNSILLFLNIPGESGLSYIYNGFASGLEKVGRQMTILHLGDEFGKDPVEFYTSPAVKRVIRNYARPNLPTEKVTFLPLGYAKGRASVGATPTFAERQYLWSFAGSMDRPGRSQAIHSLERTGNFKLADRPTWSDPAKLNANEYNKLNQQTKFVPCFRGFASLESYRLYEALEQGAIPVYVPGEKDTYVDVLGKHPILSFPSWDKAAEILPVLAQNASVMEDHRHILGTWWQAKKAEIKDTIKSVLN